MTNLPDFSRQYQPPKIPSHWSADERRFAQGVTDVLDDIYLRYGRMNKKDLSPALSKEITDASGNILLINANAEALSARMANAEGDVSSLSLRADAFDAFVADADGNYARFNLAAKRAEWLVSGGEGTSAIVLTPGAINAISQNVNIEADRLTLAAKQALSLQARSDLVLGGTNLLPNSNDVINWGKRTGATNVLTVGDMVRVSRNAGDTTTIGLETAGTFKLASNKQYTISYNSYPYYDGTMNYLYILSAGGNFSISQANKITLGKTTDLIFGTTYGTRYAVTFTCPRDVPDARILFGFESGTAYATATGFYLSKAQIEYGPLATDWSPSPLDIEGRMSAAELLIKPDAITATVRNHANYKSDLSAKNRTFVGGTPTGMIAGDLWIDSANSNLLKRYNGSTWAAVQDGAISIAQQQADKIQWLVADGTSGSNMTLTSQLYSLMAANIDLSANNSIKLAVTSQSANLFPSDPSNWVQGAIASADGSNSASTTRIRSADYIILNAGTLYTVSRVKSLTGQIYLHYFNSSNAYIGNSGAWVTTYPYSFSLPSGATKMRVIVRTAADGTIVPTDVPNILFSIVPAGVSGGVKTSFIDITQPGMTIQGGADFLLGGGSGANEIGIATKRADGLAAWFGGTPGVSGSAKTKLWMSGKLESVDVNLKGTIEATAGKIGGFTLSGGQLVSAVNQGFLRINPDNGGGSGRIDLGKLILYSSETGGTKRSLVSRGDGAAGELELRNYEGPLILATSRTASVTNNSVNYGSIFLKSRESVFVEGLGFLYNNNPILHAGNFSSYPFPVTTFSIGDLNTSYSMSGSIGVKIGNIIILHLYCNPGGAIPLNTWVDVGLIPASHRIAAGRIIYAAGSVFSGTAANITVRVQSNGFISLHKSAGGTTGAVTATLVYTLQ